MTAVRVIARRHRSLPVAIAATVLLTTPTVLIDRAPDASAAEYVIVGGQLDWTMANAFTSSSDADRTLLGLVTSGSPGGLGGYVAPTPPATASGPGGNPFTVIDSTAPRGTDQLYSLSYPVDPSGTARYTDQGVGTVELMGSFTFAVRVGARLQPVTLTDPLITLNGLTGTLRASGSKADGTAYTRADGVQLDLDLSDAAVVLRADGSRAITGIMPVSTSETVLPGFRAGAAMFGTMTLLLNLNDPKPVVLAIPPRPQVEDPCGPTNALWELPADTSTLDWSLVDGHALVTVVSPNTSFLGGGTTFDFGLAPDSARACAPIAIRRAVLRVTDVPTSKSTGNATFSITPVSGPAKVSGEASVTIKGSSRTLRKVSVTAGKATVRLPKLRPGRYGLTVRFIASVDFRGARATARFRVVR